jgi:hypothetical protein
VGTTLPTLSGGMSLMSATVASLVHPKLAGGSCQTHLFWQACLFKVYTGACPSTFLWNAQRAHLLCYVSFFCPLFFIQFFFPKAGIRLSSRLCWFIPGVAVGISFATYLLTCWFASPEQFRSPGLAMPEPSWFFCIMWHGVPVCRLGVQGCHSFASSWWFFLAGVSPAFQQDFGFKELRLSAPSL